LESVKQLIFSGFLLYIFNFSSFFYKFINSKCFFGAIGKAIKQIQIVLFLLKKQYFMNEQEKEFITEAIRLSISNVEDNKGGPFGAVVVKDGKIIARGTNCVTAHNDPTAHAEVVAIREACKVLNSFQLTGCQIYSSCEPCPMCLAAIYWARPDKLFYANSKEDAAAINFDDMFIYQEMAKPITKRMLFTQQINREEAIVAFEKWRNSNNKIVY
jgi:guanine deaminase